MRVAIGDLCCLALIWFVSGLSTNCSATNVVFIVADDLNCAIGPYGDRVAQTPNLDRLAARGMTFERAYCQQAVCNPSRASFLTGLRPDTVGVDDLRLSFRTATAVGGSLVTLPEHFKRHGYDCRDIGKIFHNTGETQDRRSWSADEVLFRGTHAEDTLFAQRTPKQDRAYKAPVTESFDVDDHVYRDGKIGDLAAKAILERDEDAPPLFLACGFWRPHLPFVAPKKYWDLYDPGQIPMPDPSEPPVNAPTVALHSSKELRSYGPGPRDRSLTPDEVRHLRHGYYASISFLDAQVGKILDALHDSGLERETIVVFTSDHGFHLGEHSLWGKTSNFELDARVPLLVAGPGVGQSGTHTHALVELIDLYPTLANLCGIEGDLSESLEGTNLTPVMSQRVRQLKGAAFTQNPHPFYQPRERWTAIGYSIRSERWRYTEWWSLGGAERRMVACELYDHVHDPRESVNVVNKADREVVSKLQSRLRSQYRLSALRPSK